MTLQNKSIMIVAGGEWQVPIIMKAKSLGYFVINTNLYHDSPGFEYSDVGLVANVLDRERNLEFARKYKPDAIITDQSDIAVPTVAFLCNELGLPGIGMKAAELFTNKHAMRIFCREKGFPVPEFRLCRNLEEIYEFGKAVGYPFVIKPPANQSSRGVHKVHSRGELNGKYSDAFAHSSNGCVLAEEFINGPEFTVEGFKTHDHAYSLAVSVKQHFTHTEMVASSLLYSHDDARYDYGELKLLNERLVEMMQLPFGITHAEYKLQNGRFYLIEIAARGGGTKISSHIIPEMSGIDVNELLIRCATGEIIETIDPTVNSQYVILDFFLFPSGTVRAVGGLDWMSGNPSVIDFGMNFKIGETITPPADDRARHGYYIARAKSKSELKALCSSIQQRVSVQVE